MKILLIIFCLLPLSLFAELCSNNLDSIPTQVEGRTKPLKVVAYETFKFLTHSKNPLGMDMTKAFCTLSISNQLEDNFDLPLKVEHIKIQEMLKVKTNEAPAGLIDENETNLKMSAFAIKENNSLKKELNKVLYRLQIYRKLTSGEYWTLMNDKGVWRDLVSFNYSELEKEISSQAARVEQFSDAPYKLELIYFNTHPFSWSLLLSLLAIFALIILKKNTIALTLTSLIIILEIVAIAVRVFISGRAPITNMYETVMFSGFGALIISVILTLVKKEKIFTLGGLSYNMLCLMMMIFANGMLDPSIKPLVPVLRDNFWLSTHVTTIILSYAALALSWILANIILLQISFKKSIDKKQIKRQTKIIYSAIQVGVVLLSLGIILGGVWADYSWGRFWGWDPKETWSLIVLLVYAAILHGRYTSWIKDKDFVLFCAAAFMSVMMAWFGVNYILASGLHSYGFSEGGAIFLGSFFFIQTGFLIFAYFKIKRVEKLLIVK